MVTSSISTPSKLTLGYTLVSWVSLTLITTNSSSIRIAMWFQSISYSQHFLNLYLQWRHCSIFLLLTVWDCLVFNRLRSITLMYLSNFIKFMVCLIFQSFRIQPIPTLMSSVTTLFYLNSHAQLLFAEQALVGNYIMSAYCDILKLSCINISPEAISLYSLSDFDMGFLTVAHWYHHFYCCTTKRTSDCLDNLTCWMIRVTQFHSFRL